MNSARKARLKAKGWRSGSAADLLGLTPEESYFVELKLRLADDLKQRRPPPRPRTGVKAPPSLRRGHREAAEEAISRLRGGVQPRGMDMNADPGIWR